MAKITKFYINKANYIAEDENGRKYSVTLDYWNNSFTLDTKNITLEKSARKFLGKKHRVNFVEKLVQ